MTNELPTPEEIAELRRLVDRYGMSADVTFRAYDAVKGRYVEHDLTAELPSLLDAAERVRWLEADLKNCNEHYARAITREIMSAREESDD